MRNSPRKWTYRRPLAFLTAPLLLLLAAPGGLILASSASAANTFNAVDYAQCANGAPPSTALDCPGGWINGILNPNNSHYHENQVTPQRLEVAFNTAGPHSVTISYLDRTGGVHAYDSLATWNYTQTGADHCQDLSAADCVVGPSATYPIPADTASVPPFTAPASSDVVSAHTLPGQVFTLYGGTITGTSSITHGANVADPNKDDYATITVNFTIPAGGNNTVQLLFGGHLAAGVGPNGWGTNLGASAVPGGNYHIKWIAADGIAVGNRDNQIMSGAVLPAQNTSIVTTASAAPSAAVTVGSPISDSATVTPSAASGQVVFTAYGPVSTSTPTCTTQAFQSAPQTVVGGSAGPVSFTPTAPGYYFWVATFTPTDPALFTTASETCSESVPGEVSEVSPVVVGPAAPTITTSANPPTGTTGTADTFGDTATFDATALAPSGVVTFTLYSNSTCTTAVSGMSGSGAISITSGTSAASFTKAWTPSTAGTYYWLATYAGDQNNKASTTHCTDAGEQIVVGSPSTPGVVTTPAPKISTLASPATGTAGTASRFGDTATFDATALAPSGVVTFTLYSNSTCTTAVSGMSGSGAISTTSGTSAASFTKAWTPSTAGTYYWLATYAGDQHNKAYTTGCTDAHEQIVVGSPSPPGVVTTAPKISTPASPASPATTVLGEKFSQPPAAVTQPQAAMLPFTGAPIPLQLAAEVAIGLIGAGVAFAAVARRRDRGQTG